MHALSQKIHDAFAKRFGLLSITATPITATDGLRGRTAVQEVIRRDNLLDNVKAMGARLAQRLNDRFHNHAHVGDVRGRGLFMALELVEDRSGKAPFDPKLKLNARVKREAMARGLMVYPAGGTIDGARGDQVLLAPPFIVDAQAIDTIVERLGDAVDAAIASIAARAA